MREILFGVALGTVIGALLYKKNECAKDLIDQGERMVKKEIEKMEKENNKNKQK